MSSPATGQASSAGANDVMTAVDRLLEMLVFVALAAMATIVFVNVVLRKGFGFSLSWGEELPLALMCWLTFLGAGLATKERRHFAFDYLMRALPPRLGRSLMIFSDVVVILMTCALIWWSTVEVWNVRDGKLASIPWMSKSAVIVSCPVGCVFILIYAIRHLIEDWRNRNVRPPPGPAEELAE